MKAHLRLVAGLAMAATLLDAGAANLLDRAGGLLGDLRSAITPASAPSAAPPPSTSSPPSPSPSPSPSPTASPAPAAQPRPAPGATPAAVTVGRKRVPLSSSVVDLHCQRVVDPFELNANVGALASLATSGVADSLPGLLTRGGSAQASGHRISRSVREQALLLNWMPMTLEQRYGQLIHDDALTAGVLVERDSTLGKRLYPKADELLATILSGVDEPHPYRFELYIRKANENNAMALPGGIVYIDAGLLRDADLAMARFALAHEISHVLRRHETRIAQARVIDTISLTGAASDLVSVVRDPASLSTGVLKTAAAGHKSFRQHYGDQELQADSCAVRVLYVALDNPVEVDKAIGAFIATLPADAPPAKATGSGPGGVGDLVVEVSQPVDRHPSTRERIDNLKAVRTAAKDAPAVTR